MQTVRFHISPAEEAGPLLAAARAACGQRRVWLDADGNLVMEAEDVQQFVLYVASCWEHLYRDEDGIPDLPGFTRID